MIQEVKKETNEILLKNKKISRLNEEEFKDFMILVRELNNSDINVLID